MIGVLSSACPHSAVPKEQLQKQQQHGASFCCSGQQSGSPKVVRSLKSNRTIGTVRPFGHWKASAADPKPEGPGWVGGSNLYTEPKDLETNHSTHSLAELYVIPNEKFCMLTLCCTKRATAKATTARRIFLLQRATERFAEGCPFGHWQASAALNKETKTANKQTKQLCVVCQSSSH